MKSINSIPPRHHDESHDESHDLILQLSSSHQFISFHLIYHSISVKKSHHQLMITLDVNHRGDLPVAAATWKPWAAHVVDGG